MAVIAGAIPEPRTKRFKRKRKSGLNLISLFLSPTTFFKVCMQGQTDQRIIVGKSVFASGSLFFEAEFS